MIDPNILTGLMYVGSVFVWGMRGYLGVTCIQISGDIYAFILEM